MFHGILKKINTKQYESNLLKLNCSKAKKIKMEKHFKFQ